MVGVSPPSLFFLLPPGPDGAFFRRRGLFYSLWYNRKVSRQRPRLDVTLPAAIVARVAELAREREETRSRIVEELLAAGLIEYDRRVGAEEG